MDERAYYLSFSLAPGIGPKRLLALLDTFGLAEKAWNGEKSKFQEAGIPEKVFDAFEKFRDSLKIESYLKKLHAKQVTFVALCDEQYPKKLKEIENPPTVLFVKGSVESLSLPRSIGVVGTRKMTSYGKEVTENLVIALASYGFTIVSGLALGVDSVAHKSAIEGRGKTVAVLGCGVDCCYPRENEWLYKKIIDGNGAVVSEYSLSQPPSPGSFPARNRIIAGVSDAVLVTEAGQDSGALITAKHAFDTTKSIFAVPGPITSRQSAGTAYLIKKGAKLITGVSDIIEEFGLRTKVAGTKVDLESIQLTPEERSILELLQDEPLHIDDLCRKSSLDIAKLTILVSGLEIRGILRDLGGGVFGI